MTINQSVLPANRNKMQARLNAKAKTFKPTKGKGSFTRKPKYKERY